jgi:hypothetical protein
MAAKMDYFLSLYDGRMVQPGEENSAADYAWDLRSCEVFEGSHPAVMRERIRNKNWETPPIQLKPRWRNSVYWKGLFYKNTRTFRRWADTAGGMMRKAS